MSKPTDLSELMSEFARLRARVDEQAAEIAALRADPAPEPDRRVSRRHLLTGLAGLSAAGAASVAGASPAAAADSDPLVLGQDNTSSTTTRLTTATGGSQPYEFATELNSDAYATLAVGVSSGSGGEGGRAALIVDCSQSTQEGAAGVQAFASDGFAVEAVNHSVGWPTVAGFNQGVGTGLGGASAGGGAQLWLDPLDSTTVGPPSSGYLGYIRLDAAGDLWVCTESGTPGTWTRLLREDTTAGRMVPITPFRALDTRSTGGRPPGAPAVPGQRKGPVRGGETITLDLAGITPIPTTATGLFGNLIVVDPTYDGYARVRPSDSDNPASSVNFAAGINALANSFTSALGPAGLTLSASGTTTDRVHLVLDVAGYLT